MDPINSKYLLEAIINNNYKPDNKWEEDFLHSVEELIENRKYLSTNQGNKLSEIYRKSAGGGQRQKRQYIN